MAELTYGEARMTIEEVASLTVYQFAHVVCRKRDKHGRLIRAGGLNDLPQHVLDSMDADGNRRVRNRKPLGDAYIRAKMSKGLSQDEAVAQWQGYLKGLQEERAALNAAKRGKSK